MIDTTPQLLARLNSATKYPSILTYHQMGEKGRLLEDLTFPTPAEDLPIVATEKIDGTNSRIIVSPDGDFIIGSREDLLYAKGDRILNESQSIVPTLMQRSLASDIAQRISDGLNWHVVFGESYGGRISSASKNYASSGETRWHAFDVMQMSDASMQMLLTKDPAHIASWRDNGGQKFVSYEHIHSLADVVGFSLVPFIHGISRPPTGVAETAEWLKNVSSQTLVAIGEKRNNPGRSEGIILRSYGRSFIVKIRHEDYERTLRTR